MCGDIKRGRRLSGPSRGCLRVGANWGHARVWSTPQTRTICAGNYTPSTIIQRTYVLHSDGRNSKANNVQPQSACRRQALPARLQPLSRTHTSPSARLREPTLVSVVSTIERVDQKPMCRMIRYTPLRSRYKARRLHDAQSLYSQVGGGRHSGRGRDAYTRIDFRSEERR